MANKITQKEMFTEVIAVLKGEESAIEVSDMVEFLKGRIEKLEKKSASKSPTKTQVENEGIKEVILATLSDQPMTITDLQKANVELGVLSNQKVSALVRQLVVAEKVVRAMEGKKVVFTLV